MKKRNDEVDLNELGSGKKSGKKVAKYTTLGCLGPIVLAVIAVVIVVAVMVNGIGDKVPTPSWPSVPLNSGQSMPELEVIDEDVYNVLLIGVDSRTESLEGNTDSMILVSLDNTHQKLKMVSFMRDSWVTIPGYYDMKLNHAYTLGGPELLMDTIEYNYNFKIDKYAIVNFEMFEQVVDTLGGVEIELTQDEVDHLDANYYGTLGELHEGVNLMDGNAALSYARIRKMAGDDFQRTQRQRNVIQAVVKSAKNMDVFKIVGLANSVLPNVKTNIPTSEILSLAYNSMTYLQYPVEEFRLPADNTWKYGSHEFGSQMLSTVDYDTKENGRLLHEFIYEDGTAAEESSPSGTSSSTSASRSSSSKK